MESFDSGPSTVGLQEELEPSSVDSFLSECPNDWDIARFSQCLLQIIFIHSMLKIMQNTNAWYYAKIFLLGTYPP